MDKIKVFSKDTKTVIWEGTDVKELNGLEVDDSLVIYRVIKKHRETTIEGVEVNNEVQP